MSPKTTDVLESLKPYINHGVELDYRAGDKEAIGQCPWCGKEEKFSVNASTGVWRCLVCAEGTEKGGGNSLTFLRLLLKKSLQATSNQDYQILAKDRSLLVETLKAWQVAKNFLNDRWIIPAFSVNGKLTQLYRYSRIKDKMRLLATATLSHGIFGMNQFDAKSKNVYICEGPWDAMALWQEMKTHKILQGKAVITGNADASIFSSSNIIAVPGCETFDENWSRAFKGKKVFICFDNDHERVHPQTGKPVASPGYKGMQRVASVLNSNGFSPKETRFLNWSGNASTFNRDLPNGCDIRDYLYSPDLSLESPPGPPGRSTNRLNDLLGYLVECPTEWLTEEKKSKKMSGNSSNNSSVLDCLECNNYRDLVTSWRKAMHWTPGLDKALSVMLACITSTNLVGDQLWVKIIGPASCGKSTLCEAVSIATEFVLAKSVIRGFHSGFGDGEEDNSLIAKVNGKTLVTKDGDTLLQSPNLSQILSEGRDVYDKVSRTEYRNKNSRDYLNVRMTWILCGTSSLRSIDSSELGERFIDCVIMQHIDADEENDILLRTANKAERNLSLETGGDVATHEETEMNHAKQLTGGYIHYLRENVATLMAQTEMDIRAKKGCINLAKFIACMRARPSVKQKESAERELAARLTSQMVRLAKCLAVVMNKSSVDAVVMNRVREVALDTARGKVMEIAGEMYANHDKGCDPKGVALHINMADAETKNLLRFLRTIGVAETFAVKIKGVTRKARWRLTEDMLDLYSKVVLNWSLGGE